MTEAHRAHRDKLSEKYGATIDGEIVEIYPYTNMKAAYREGYDAAHAEAEVLVKALEKIADPRLRDHKEPDKYTEVGCMMHMADEALKAWRLESGEAK